MSAPPTLRGLEVQGRARAAPWAGRTLLAVTGALVTVGLLSVYSASSFLASSQGLPDSHYLVEQAMHAGVGGAALLVARFLDYRLYRRLAWPLLGVTAVALLLVLLPGTEALAPRVNGARRWLRLGVAFQPSELAKFTVVVWTAALAVRKQDRLDSFRFGIAPFLVVVAPLSALVLLEPHLSAAVTLTLLSATVLFAAGAPLRHFAVPGLAAVPLLWHLTVSAGYRLNRLAAFVGEEGPAGAAGYQLRQSLIAVGSGGIAGVGFGASRQKLYYLPEPQNDFIFPIIAEEWGFLGSVVVVGLLLTWILVALRIASSAPDLFGRLLGVGLTAIVATGALAHLGVTLGLLPTTGVNLPFVSAGGTHLVLSLGLTGVLLNLAAQRSP